MELTWDVQPDQMARQLVRDYSTIIRNRLLAIARNRAPQIEAWMKANHLWQNRTSEAESTLSVTFDEVEDGIVEILLAHGTLHGWWLEGYDPRNLPTLRETMQGGKFSILAPALDHWSAVLENDLQEAFG